MKNVIKFSALFLLLVVFPLGSFYYLYQGRAYFRANMKMLEAKGKVPAFEYYNTEGDTISQQKMKGSVWVVHWVPDNCTDCKPIFETMDMVSQQFHERKTAQFVTCTEQADGSKSSYYTLHDIDAKTKRANWQFANKFSNAQFQQLLKTEPSNYHQLILVDDSLNIRKYYDTKDPKSMGLLIRHLAMILPKEKKKEIGFEREKEK